MSANPNLKLNVLNDSGAQIFFVNQTTGINSTLISTNTNTTTSTNSTSASCILSGGLSIASTTNSTSYTAGGATTIAGGLAVGNDSFIGGTVYTPRVSSGSIATPGFTVGTVYVTSITGGTIQVSGNTSIGSNLVVAGLVQFNSTTVSSNSSTANTVLRGGLSISSSNASSYTAGGGLTISGGLAVSQDAYVGDTVFTPRISAGSIATPGITAGILYVSSITSGSIQVSGDVTIGGSLTVLGSTTVLNVTTANQVETNVTSSNIFLLGNLIAGGNSHTLGNIYTTGGNVGINTTSPGATLDVNGTARFTTSVTTANLYSTNVVSDNISSTNLVLTNNNTGGSPLSTTSVIIEINPYPNVNAFIGDAANFTTNNEFTAEVISPDPTGVIQYNPRLFNYIKNKTGTTLNLQVRFTGTITKTFSELSQQLNIYDENNNIVSVICSFTVPASTDPFGWPPEEYNLDTGYINVNIPPNYKIGANGTGYIPTIIFEYGTAAIISNALTVIGNSSLQNISTGNINFTGSLSQNGSPYVGSQWRGTSGNISFGTAGSSLVGINTQTPSYTLEVNGTFEAYNSNGLMAFTQNGQVGIGTVSPGEALDVRGNLRIGNSSQSNYISFYGTTGDEPATWSHTYIGERIYGGNENSELLLFKGNDMRDPSGPDRIRLLAAEHRFDTYTTDVSGTFQNVASTIASTRMIVSTTGSIGIGTITPSYTLDVNGSSSTIQANGTNNTPYIPNCVFSNNSSITGAAVAAFLTPNMSANSWNQISYFGKSLSLGNSVSLGYNYVGNNNSLNFMSLNHYGLTGGIYFLNNGNVGINTTNPVFTLDISGTSRVTGTLSATHDTNTIGNIFTTGGNVGINTTTPSTRLHVHGVDSNSNTAYFSGFDINKRTVIANDGTRGYLLAFNYNNTSVLDLFLNSPGGNILTGPGSVGISTTSPNYKLDVNGSLNATTSITTAVLYSTNQTTINGVFTNLSSGTISLTTLTTANVYSSLGTFSNLVGVNLSSSNLISTVATIPNSILSNITSNTIVVTGGGLSATFNSNTIGNIFTTGGNIGVGTAAPASRLHLVNPSTLNTNNMVFEVGTTADGINAGWTAINWNGYYNTGEQRINTGKNRWRLVVDQRTTGDNLIFDTYNGTTLTTILTMSSSGNVNIANTANIPTISSGNILTTNITTTSLNVTNSTFGGIVSTNLVGTNNTLVNLNLTSQTTINALFTNISTTSLNAATGVFATGITSGIGWFTNSLTAGNFFANNITIGSIFATTMTLSTLLMTTGITTPNILVTNLTATNVLVTNSSVTSSRVTNEIATNISSSTINVSGITAGNINFTGNLYQNGSIYISSQWTTFGTNLAYTTGNVGINTTSPTFTLDTNGTGRFRSTAFSTNSTSGALVVGGGVSITGTNAASNTMGGGLTVAGGVGVSQDLYVGGNIYFKGIDATVITGTESIGSNAATGTYQTNITLPRTMDNTTYKIVGALKSTTNNTNVYNVSFTNVTTSGFTANIYRLDALGSGWTDTNLVLSYVVYP